MGYGNGGGGGGYGRHGGGGGGHGGDEDAGAEYLASIFGTEKDKVNCSFYFKIGACRHGDRCSRIHNKPTFSQTLCLQNFYVNPQNATKTADGTAVPGIITMSDEEAQEHFDNFFEDVFAECEDKYGEIEEMKHKMEALEGQARGGGRRPRVPFTSADQSECTRSGFCNFMHLKPISRELRRELYGRKRRGSSPTREKAPRPRSRERRRSRSRERRDRSGRF